MNKLTKKQLAMKKQALKEISETLDIYLDGSKYDDVEDLMEALTFNTLCMLLDAFGPEYVNETIRKSLWCYLDRTNEDLIAHPEYFKDPIQVGKGLTKVKEEIEMLEDLDQVNVCDDCKKCQNQDPNGTVH